MTTTASHPAARARLLGVTLDLLLQSLVMTARMLALHPPHTPAAGRGAPPARVDRRR